MKVNIPYMDPMGMHALGFFCLISVQNFWVIAATKRPKLMHQSKANCKLQTLHELIGSLSHYLHGFLHPRWLALGCLNPSTVPLLFFDDISLLSEIAATWTCLTGNKSLAERDQVHLHGHTNWVPQSWAICHWFAKPTCCDQKRGVLLRRHCCTWCWCTLFCQCLRMSWVTACLECNCFMLMVFSWSTESTDWRCICGCCRSLHKLYNYGMFWLNGRDLATSHYRKT